MNILFVCRYNRFRSRIAEALFNHYNKNKNIEVRSAGISVDYDGQYILPRAAEVLDKLGIEYTDKKVDLVNDSLLDWADKIIVVADDIPIDIFPESKTVQIDIPDSWSTADETMDTAMQIDKFVRKLAKNIS